VSDPYNSYGASVPPTTPPAAGPAPRAKADPIARLDVSESWKQKFKLIEKAGGPDLPHFRDLPFGERFGLNFNILACIFGPFYYLVKGLWRQAILYFIFAVALVLLLEAVGLGKFSRGVGYGFSVVYALRANISYYKKVVLGETPWL
jgi:hypothetical protein